MALYYCLSDTSHAMADGTLFISGGTQVIGPNASFCYSGSQYRVGILPFTVSSGGLQSNTLEIEHIVSTGKKVTVRSGGIAASTSVVMGGQVDVQVGGIATSTSVVSGGRVYVQGGTIKDTVINSGALCISDSGTGVNIIGSRGSLVVLNEGYVTGYSAADNFQTIISSGGTVTDVNMSAAGAVQISAGGLLLNTTITDTKMYIKGGSAQNITVNLNGSVSVNSTKLATSLVVKGIVSGIIINSGGRIGASGGDVYQITVNSSGLAYLQDTDRILINSKASARVETISSLAIVSGGSLTLIKSAVLVDVKSSGTVSIIGGTAGSCYAEGPKTVVSVTSSGGYINLCTIGSGGYVYPSYSGKVGYCDVLSGGILALKQGGSLAIGVVRSGGNLYVSSGGTAQIVSAYPSANIVLAGGSIISRILVLDD